MALGVLLAAAAGRMAAPAHAGEPPEPTSASTTPTSASTTLPEPGRGVPGNIIPEPNTGIAPEEPGDRGGWQQWAVLGLIVAGLAVIAVVVTRESLRKRPRGPGAPRTGGAPD